MNVRALFAALFALLTLLILTLTGCTDAGKCVRGSDGCLSRPSGHELGRCDPDLSYEDGVCVDNGGGGGDGDGDGDGDSEPRDAGPMPDVECDGDSKEAICDSFCEMFCYNQIRFCGASECLPEDCEKGGDIYEACATRCTNVSCATQLCRDQADPELVCNDYGSEKTVQGVRTYQTLCIERDPLCVQKAEIGCSDVCGSDNGVNGEYVDNGVCEDGHADAESSACDRGTDCTDCYPHPCKQAGGDCVNHGDCCGFYGVGALCVDPDGANRPKTPVCFPTCDEENPCPMGFMCNPTTGARDVCVEIP